MRRLSKHVPIQAMALKPEAGEANALPARALAASSTDKHDAEAKL